MKIWTSILVAAPSSRRPRGRCTSLDPDDTPREAGFADKHAGRHDQPFPENGLEASSLKASTPALRRPARLDPRSARRHPPDRRGGRLQWRAPVEHDAARSGSSASASRVRRGRSDEARPRVKLDAGLPQFVAAAAVRGVWHEAAPAARRGRVPSDFGQPRDAGRACDRRRARSRRRHGRPPRGPTRRRLPTLPTCRGRTRRTRATSRFCCRRSRAASRRRT